MPFWLRHWALNASVHENADNVMLIGAGNAGQMILRDFKRAKEVKERVVCFIDDTMTGRQPMEHIPDMLGCCDAAFLSFMDNELFTKTIPAKLQSYMACGIPIIASALGESERIISEANCGLCSPIGNVEKLAENIRALMNDSEIAEKGRNARKYFEEHFEKKLLMDGIDEYLK